MIPGEVKLRIEELTKEQLVVEVLKLQRMLDSRPDRDKLKRLAALEEECDRQGSVLDRTCELLHRFGHETPDLPSIAKAFERALYHKPGLVTTILCFGDGQTLTLQVDEDSPLAESSQWSLHVR
jgi:hypothetical protein